MAEMCENRVKVSAQDEQTREFFFSVLNHIEQRSNKIPMFGGIFDIDLTDYGFVCYSKWTMPTKSFKLMALTFNVELDVHSVERCFEVNERRIFRPDGEVEVQTEQLK